MEGRSPSFRENRGIPIRPNKSKGAPHWRPFPSPELLTPLPLPSLTTHSLDSAEPLPRTVALLTRGVDHPLLRVCVHHLRSHPVEPLRGQLRVAHSPPEFADEIGEHRPFIARNTLEALQRLL